MKYTVRKLESTNDFIEANSIFKSHKKLMRSYFDRTGKQIENLDDHKNNYFGCFYEEKLVAFLRVTFWNVLPVYQVGNMNIKSGTIPLYDFKNPNHPIIPIMNYILNLSEEKNYYTWYYNRSLSPGYHKLQLEGKDLLRNCSLGYDDVKKTYRYDRFIEEIVEAGNRPKFEVHKNMQPYIFDKDYMIIKCCLKNEYRSLKNYFDNRVIEECLKITQ